MFKTIKAAWKVLNKKDINSEELIDVAPVPEEVLEKMRHDAKVRCDEATDRREPYIEIVTMDVDYNDLNNGSVEFEWNTLWIDQLIRAGYQGKTDADLVDQWYTNVCRNVVLETYEQANADPVNRVNDLGDGRREYK